MAESETPHGAAPVSGIQNTQQTEQPPQQQPAAEWQQKFPGGPDEIWKAYTSLQSKYDKDRAEWTKGGQSQPATPKGAAAWDFSTVAQGYESFAQRIDVEAAKGEFSPEVASVIQAMGADPDFYREAVQYRQTKRLEPLKQYIEGDHDQIMQTVAANIDSNRREAFQNLLDAGEYEAAAAIVKSVLSKVQSQGAAPQVGQVTTSPGGGYKSFKELYDAMSENRFQWDSEYQETVKRKYDATPQAIKDEWNKQYGTSQ